MMPQHDKKIASEWIDRLIEESLDEADAGRLDALLAADAEARARYIDHVSLISDLEAQLAATSGVGTPVALAAPTRRHGFGRVAAFAAAAVIAIVAISQFRGRGQPGGSGSAVIAPAVAATHQEPTAEGFAFVRHLSDAELFAGADRVNVGDALSGRINLKKGHAQIDFFCGASAVVEGPAVIDIVSAWEAFCVNGRMQVRVPPAAEGFIVRTASSRIRDLGTEFSLEASDSADHVSVIEGKVSIAAGAAQPVDLTQGQAMRVPRDRPEQASRSDTAGWTAPPMSDRWRQGTRDSLDRWQISRAALRRDPRLIAFYDFDSSAGSISFDDILSDLTEPAACKHDGTIIGAKRARDRWGNVESALEFKQPGSRVRVALPGEFDALTLAAWVRIDSLDRWYNALFMVDGFKKGQPHWQIRDDGRLMLGVLIDDHWKGSPDGPRNYNYLSPPIWTMARSGQWMHLASVFNPAQRYCAHYLNGKEISREPITDENRVALLRIGAAEIGNWGQPFRSDPKFAIRSFNGCIDEVMLFRAALSSKDIEQMHRQSQPVGW